MILEGFEIENWACIKKVTVANLPPTGVIVLHGPNRRGKSSIVQALRACLLDNASKSQALKSYYPRGTGEQSVVSVTFQAGGVSYRVTKHFGTNKSELRSKTPEGAWKVETTSPADVHEKTCNLAGGDDSRKGLHQLLWLTQTEFRLPEAKKFDTSVQTQLRGILGVLQTKLDDCFIERVKDRWHLWFIGQRKPGKDHEIKDSCKLAENLKNLGIAEKEMQESEGQFQEMERLLRQTADLEVQKADLERQLADRSKDREVLREEQQRCQVRIAARERAEKDHGLAEKEQHAAVEEQQGRQNAVQRCLDDDKAVEPAEGKVTLIAQNLNALLDQRQERRKDLDGHREKRRDLQDRANLVNTKLRTLRLVEQDSLARGKLEQAQWLVQEIADLERYLADFPIPDEAAVEAIKANRLRATQLRAEQEAASMNLALFPTKDCPRARLSLEGGSIQDLPLSEVPIRRTVRRKAELQIGGWGRVELTRGIGSGNLDEIEDKLRRCNEEFATALGPLGFSANDPQAMQLLLNRIAEHAHRTPTLAKQKKEVKKLAPQGIESLHRKVVESQTLLGDQPGMASADVDPLPADPGELDKLAETLKQQIGRMDTTIDKLDQEDRKAENHIAKEQKKETTAKEELAGYRATANSAREEVNRLRSEEDINRRIEDANRALQDAQAQLKQTELTEEERTVEDRLEAMEEAVEALQRQIDENTKKYHEMKGILKSSEGLHARRASLAARVDELTRMTARESLEKDAIDRLYALFEECREKQLGTVLRPIQDRVLNWMRVLDIGKYKELRFNDAFLPEQLLTSDGTAGFSIDEESTGAQEQIGMLVRLALGSILTSAEEPAVAILDDPLTHSDIGRLTKMRVILRRAAEGDQKLNPPAGPLQIVVLTCHPEWFRDERATVIDLENPEVMSRWNV